MATHYYNKSGFTLVELLVSISIISLMLAFLLPNFMGARERARDAQKKEDLNSIKNALRLYYNDVQSYPNLGASLMSPYTADLGVTLAAYMPGLANIGFGYSYYGGGDSFYIWSLVEATKLDEWLLSQQKCGLGLGETMANSFMVCAK